MCNTMTYITKQYKHVKSANNSLQHPSILMLKGRGLVFLADVVPCLNGGGESYILSQAEDYPVLHQVLSYSKSWEFSLDSICKGNQSGSDESCWSLLQLFCMWST